MNTKGGKNKKRHSMMLATLTGSKETDKTVDQAIAEMSDDSLMLAYGRGDEAAFEAIYLRYKQPIYQYLFRNCNDLQATDEMFQTVWLRLISAAQRYQSRGRFRSYLFTLAHNALVDFYRANQKNKLQEDDPHPEIDNTPSADRGNIEQISAAQRQEIMEGTLNAMSAVQREAFYLRQESDFSIEEIAEIQNISREAAKSRLRYAYGKLRSALRDAL